MFWVRPLYLLSSSKSMVKTGHVGHDSSFIRLGGVDDIYGIEMEEESRWQKIFKPKKKANQN